MGKIYIDTSKLKKCYTDTTKVKKIYIGTDMAFQSAIPVAKPTAPSAVTWDGSTHYAWANMPQGIVATGTTQSAAAGTWTAYFTPDAEHIWSDDTRDTVAITWTINRASVGAKPTGATYNYNGSYRSPYNVPSYVNASGDTSKKDGGNYTAYYTPDSNHCWSDNTYNTVTVAWTIQYVWTKWNAVLSYATRIYTESSPEWIYNGGSYGGLYIAMNTNYSFDTANGKYTLSGSGATGYREIPTSGRDTANCDGKYCSPPSANGANGFGELFTVTNGYENRLTLYPNSIGSYYLEYTLTWYKSTSSYSKGSTNYGNVASTNVNAYPQGGRAGDGYWYVKTW